VPVEIAHAAAPAHEYVVAEWAGERGLWFFGEYRDQPLTQPELQIAVTDAPADGHAHRTVPVSISSEVLVRDLVLEVDRVHPEARALAGLVTLLPGETVTIPVRLPAGVPADALGDASLVRTANELVAGASA
jgi:beta-mannosidase